LTASHTQPNWRKTKLGDYFRIKHGYAFKGEFFSDEGPYVLLTPGNFQVDGGIKLKGEREKYYTGDFPKEFLLKRGDFLIVMTDLTQNAPILGSPALIKEDDKFLHNQRLGKIVELNESEMDRMFLYYLFNTTSVRAQIKASATGATVRHTAPDRIYAVKVEVPSLSIQRRIASILSAYDDLIENNARRIKILEEMARLIYREWFVEFRAPGVKLRKATPEEKKVTGKDVFPVGWELKRLGDMCTIVMGQSPKSEFYNEKGEGLPFHQGVTDFGDRFPANRVYCTVENRIAETGDVLFSVRAPVGRINIANKKIVIGRGLCAIRSKTGSQTFVFQQLKEQFQEEDTMGGGTIFKSVTKEDMHGIKAVSPTPDVIVQFEEIVSPIFKELEVLTEKCGILRRTRDLLLPKLVSGEVEKLSIG